MISTLKKRGDIYYCSNCQMRQLKLTPNCFFCGNLFSNYESVAIEKQKEEYNIKVKELKNESNLSGKN